MQAGVEFTIGFSYSIQNDTAILKYSALNTTNWLSFDEIYFKIVVALCVDGTVS